MPRATGTAAPPGMGPSLSASPTSRTSTEEVNVASTKEVEARIKAIVEGATETGEDTLAVKLIMRELNLAALDGYDKGYKDSLAGNTSTIEKLEKW